MYLEFKNFTNSDVVMQAIDGTQALVTAGNIAILDEKFAPLADHSCIRQLTFAPAPVKNDTQPVLNFSDTSHA